MLTDMMTIIRKDIKEIMTARGTGKRGGWMSVLITIGLLGILMPLQTGVEWLTNPVLPILWSWFPVILVVSVVTDSFAGERERNTLETLLASRLTDESILFGKISAAVLYGWGLGMVGNLLGAVTVNIVFWQGQLMFYQPLPYLAFVFASFLICLLMGSIGVLVSLNAPTARGAYQKLSIIMLAVWFIPTIGITALPMGTREEIGRMLETINLPMLGVGLLIVVLISDLVLIIVARQRFKRAKLILN